MTSTPWRLTLALCALSAAAGCGDNPVGTPLDDAGADVSTDLGSDAGTPTDLGTPTDRGTDAGNPVDTPAPNDDGTGTDAGDLDAGADVVTPDDGPAKDGSTPLDVPSGDAPATDAPPADVPVDAGPACPASRGTITLPSTTAVSLTGTTTATGVIPSTRCQTNTGGGEAIYSLVITARTGVILSTDNDGTAFDTELSLRTSCTDPATELSCDDDSGSGSGRGNSSVMRAVLDPGTYTVIVDGYNAAAGAYTLTATTFTPADNATCATARALTVGTAVTGLTLANAGGPGYCAPGLRPGGQVFFSVELPASTLGIVRYTRPTGSWTAALRAVASCAATDCRASEVISSGSGALYLSNPDATPRTVVFSVAANDTDNTVTPFDLVVNTAPFVAGQVCSEPTAVAPGASVTAQNAAAGQRVSAACNATAANGGQLFYRVTLPAQRRAQVRVTPAGAMTAWTPTVRVLSSCAATSCLDSSTAAAAGGVAAVTLTNGADAERSYLVSVSGSATASGTFTLEVTAATALPGYTFAPITAACDDLSSGTAVATDEDDGAWDDDTVSAVATLPFAVTFYGQSVGRWAASSNGLLELFPMTGDAETSTDFSNDTIPDEDTANGFVALLWDDLRTVSTTGVRVATLGAAGSRRFVAQWTDFTLPSPDAAARITMQAKLFEGTHVIEIHYCSITPGNMRASGNSATIGAEDLDGVFGTQVSYETAGAAATGGGYRLTPR